jgi:hypothetical protein
MVSAMSYLNSHSVRELAKILADHLVETYSTVPGALPWKIEPVFHPEMNNCVNAESIDSGCSGALLFLLAFYRQFPEHTYLELIDQGLKALVQYCEGNRTNNYSLYAGRGGVVYVLLQRYLLDPEPWLLREALEMIRPANQVFLHSKYTSDYLYDGRSGALLLLLQLFRVSGEPFLLQYVRDFTRSIVCNVRAAQKGLYWMWKEEKNIRASCGLAFGAAGIHYVLSFLSCHGPDEGLQYLLDETRRFIDGSWVEAYDNWGNTERTILQKESFYQYKNALCHGNMDIFCPDDDCSWAGGTTGILYCLSTEPMDQRSSKALGELKKKLIGKRIGTSDLFEGTAGLGMYFSQAGEIELVDHCRDLLIGQMRTKTPQWEGGLMHGDPGIIYFLLQSQECSSIRETLLIPFLTDRIDLKFIDLGTSVTSRMVRRNCLNQTFPRVLSLLENAFANDFSLFLDRPYQKDTTNELDDFRHWVGGLIDAHNGERTFECLADLFYLEQEELNYFYTTDRYTFRYFLEEMLRFDRTSVQLNMPDQWMIDRKIGVSGEVMVFRTKWDWDYFYQGGKLDQHELYKKFHRNFSLPAHQHHYILMPSDRLENLEIFFEVSLSLLLQFFERPKTIREAISEIRVYLSALSPQKLRSVLTEIRVDPAIRRSELLSGIEGGILDITKKALFKGVFFIYE